MADLNVPARMKRAVLQGNSVEERLGALLVAERMSAIRELRKIRQIG